MTEILETIMLVCFGFSWPISVIKNYKAGTAKNTSLSFILLISLGYVAGISAKLLSGQRNFVLVVYFLNLFFVMMNLVVFFINSKKDRRAETHQAL